MILHRDRVDNAIEAEKKEIETEPLRSKPRDKIEMETEKFTNIILSVPRNVSLEIQDFGITFQSSLKSKGKNVEIKKETFNNSYESYDKKIQLVREQTNNALLALEKPSKNYFRKIKIFKY